MTALRMTVFLALVALMGATTAVAQGTAGITVRGISPAAPRPFENVNLRITANACDAGLPSIRVARDGADFRVTIDPRPIVCPATQPALNYLDIDVLIGAFPEGTYSVSVIVGAVPSTLQALTFQVAAPPEPTVSPPLPRPYSDYSGMWWNPAESGWGLSVHQSASRQVFLVLYVYDDAGQPVWYVAPGGTWQTPVNWRGRLFRTSGPPYTGTAFDPAIVTRIDVGEATLNFVPLGFFTAPQFGVADFRYTINGKTVQKTIQRLPF